MNELTPDERKILVDAIQDSATVVHKGRKDMNERIRELAREAGLLAYNPEGPPTKLEKFAELIVKECANRASWAQDTNEADIGGEVLKHFGVEE